MITGRSLSTKGKPMRLRTPLVMATACLAAVAVTLSAQPSWAAIDTTSVRQDMERTYGLSGVSVWGGAGNSYIGLWKDPRVELPNLPSTTADLEFEDDRLSRKMANYLRATLGFDVTTSEGLNAGLTWVVNMQTALTSLSPKQLAENPDLLQLKKMMATLEDREVGNPGHIELRRLQSSPTWTFLKNHYAREVVIAIVFTLPGIWNAYVNGWRTPAAVFKNSLTIGGMFIGSAMLAYFALKAERKATIANAEQSIINQQLRNDIEAQRGFIQAALQNQAATQVGILFAAASALAAQLNSRRVPTLLPKPAGRTDPNL